MANGDFQDRLKKDRQAFFVAGCELAEQKTFDMMCLALHDMGFGAERLKKVYMAMLAYSDKYAEAWAHTQMSDWYQEKLDAELKEIFGKIDPFNERYPNQKTWDYNKKMKGNAK
jgi:hypothetical protein